MKRRVLIFSVGSPACEQVTADVRLLAGDRWLVEVVDVRTEDGGARARHAAVTKVPTVIVGTAHVPFERNGALDGRALRALLTPSEVKVPLLVYGSSGRDRDEVSRVLEQLGGEVDTIDCAVVLADHFCYRPPSLTVVVVSAVSYAREAASAAACAHLRSSNAALVAVAPWPLKLGRELEGSFDQVIARVSPAADRALGAELARWVQYARRVMTVSGVQHRSGFVTKRGADGDS